MEHLQQTLLKNLVINLHVCRHILKNPTMLRIHNLQISENRSTVQCSVSNLANTGSQVITIFVEGKLICDNQSEDYV